ncbi:mannitol-1-phosphate 5-dehydrogenase [Geomicrobium sp. JCM 19055]|uniref:mannitol-1-phosphate 5-dehydrogenase n=1 Tax=Geomicrobium sp. JCM 19055 TaxID=1460649 RepID=UPI00045EDC0A|nr:mannitol-1-phosphate 5-dehydrogenase [Geomicrobium sp. JCM 19055]GAJ98249.1 mannitol-1-phosphate 5-dehydrogenase [Geomicrobium sp. JCM 19055]
MNAVHFGAGNIGRGFIGALLQQAGYTVTFVDVNEEVINALKSRRGYTVTIASEEQSSFQVNGVDGLNSLTEEDEVIAAITNADLVTTAVGPNILPRIAPVIAKGIEKRITATPLNIIACENAIRATSTLKSYVLEHATEVPDWIGFADAAVDRIVPSVPSEDVLAVTVEPFFEWVVEAPMLVGDLTLGEAKLVDELDPYLERKLFTVNTGHAAAAYAGMKQGKMRIVDAMLDHDIEEHVRGALRETSTILVEDYGFDEDEHRKYAERIVERYKNPYLQDTVARVGRGPIRKLGPNDRLVKPAKAFARKGNPEHLVQAIVNALEFYADDDPESEQLRALIEEHGAYEAFLNVSALSEDEPLAQLVKQKLSS